MIWLSAALGMGIGAGLYLLAIAITVVVLLILWGFPFLENRIDKIRDFRSYEITCENNLERLKKIEEIFQMASVKVKRTKQCKNKDQEMVCTFFTYGKPGDHDQVIQKLLENNDVKMFDF